MPKKGDSWYLGALDFKKYNAEHKRSAELRKGVQPFFILLVL